MIHANRELSFNVYITERCNFNCAHCLHSSNGSMPDMTDAELDYAIKYISDMLAKPQIRVLGIGVSGGEPTIHPRFLAFTKFLADMRRRYPHLRVELFSNITTEFDLEANPHLLMLFTNIWVGSGVFHGVHDGYGKMRTTQYSKMTPHLVLNRVNSIRNKGRGTLMLERFPQEFQPTGKMCCIYEPASPVWSCISFGPNKIRFCSENSHEYINEEGFADYLPEYLEKPIILIDKSIDYVAFHSKERCKTPCYAYIVKNWANDRFGSNFKPPQREEVQTSPLIQLDVG